MQTLPNSGFNGPNGDMASPDAWARLSVEQVGALNPIEVSDYLHQQARAQGKTYSVSAFKQWSAHWRRWTTSCDRSGFPRFPATMEAVLVYNQGLIERSRDIKTAGDHRRTLALVHQLAGLRCIWDSANEDEIWKQARTIVEARTIHVAREAPPYSDASDASMRAKDSNSPRPENQPSHAPLVTGTGGEMIFLMESVLAAVENSSSQILGSGSVRDYRTITALAHVVLHAANARASLSKVQIRRTDILPDDFGDQIRVLLAQTREIAEIERRLIEVEDGLEALIEALYIRDAADVRLIDSAKSSIEFCLWKIGSEALGDGCASARELEGSVEQAKARASDNEVAGLCARLDRLEARWERIGAAFRVQP